jgi:hypothetical protein
VSHFVGHLDTGFKRSRTQSTMVHPSIEQLLPHTEILKASVRTGSRPREFR